ncbi:MAG: hypothetical protein CSA21_00065 [Deltaproteobacteria bacterium]|nr:MAG: hypothetical protein CSA21_00065 [Deltaproteobacteria bacterium]
MKRVAICLITLFLLVPPVFADEGPMATLKPILTDLTSILLDKNLKGDAHRQERRARIMTEVKKGFDFREMSKRVLGRTWRTISAEQQQQFTELMTKLLENVYIGKFEEYEQHAEKYGVKYVGELVKGRRAQVTTEIAGGKQGQLVHYVMQLDGDVWKVYDVNIEGMSLIRNYQEQFKSILRTEKFAGLVKTIEKKIAELEAN